MASSSSILSRISNFKKMFKHGKVDLADSPVFKSVNFGSEDQKLKYLESFRFINSASPFFIKKEHHDMASSKMKEGQGEYWGHAIHFLLSNKAHGFPLWNEFEGQMRSEDASFSCKPHVSAETTNSAFEHYFEDSSNNFRNALEFLTQHSVLVQLPFQPVMLFQWLTSSLQYFWIVQCKFSQFYYLPAPEKFRSELVNLHKLLKTTERNIGFLFDYLQCQITSKAEIFVGNLKVFNMILKKVMVFHTCLIKGNLHEHINHLKIKCWQNWNTDVKHFQLKKGNMSLRKRNFLFNPDFWWGPHQDLKIFGNSNEQLIRVQDLSNGGIRDQLSIDALEEFFKSMIPLGCYKSIDFLVLKQRSCFLKSLHKAKQKQGIYFRLTSIKDDERGIIGDLITLNALNEYIEAFSEVFSWVVNSFRIFPKHLVFNHKAIFDSKLNTKYAKLPIDDYEKTVIDLQERCGELSRKYSKRTTYFQSKLDTGTTLDLDVDGCKFQKRILDIVLRCIETHLKIKNFKKEILDAVLRDWQVVQYLLPCFVASYFNICECDPPVEESFKDWYFKFIDKLIRTYETDGIRKSSWKNVKKDVDRITELRESFYKKNNADLLKFFKGVTEKFDKKFSEGSLTRILKYCPCLMSLYEVLTNSTKEGPPQNDVANQSCVYWNWLMWDFFSRIEKALNLSTK